MASRHSRRRFHTVTPATPLSCGHFAAAAASISAFEGLLGCLHVWLYCDVRLELQSRFVASQHGPSSLTKHDISNRSHIEMTGNVVGRVAAPGGAGTLGQQLTERLASADTSQLSSTSGHALTNLSPATKDFLAGACGGAVGVTSGHPLDTVRVRQQQVKGSTSPSVASKLLQMLRKEGVLSPFKGLTYPLFSSALQSAIMFQSYGIAMRALNPAVAQQAGRGQASDIANSSNNSSSAGTSSVAEQQASSAGCTAEQPPLSRIALAGAASGAAQFAFMTPIDVLKIRLQMQTAGRGTPSYLGPLRMLRHIVATEGPVGLFRGITVTALRDVPCFSMYFVVYHGTLRAMESGRNYSQSPSDSTSGLAPKAGTSSRAASQLAAGGLAGAMSWLCVYPLDVIKSRMQGGPQCSPARSSWIEVGKQLYAQCGTTAFSRGLGATLGRAMLVNGATFAGYEHVMQLMDSEAA